MTRNDHVFVCYVHLNLPNNLSLIAMSSLFMKEKGLSPATFVAKSLLSKGMSEAIWQHNIVMQGLSIVNCAHTLPKLKLYSRSTWKLTKNELPIADLIYWPLFFQNIKCHSFYAKLLHTLFPENAKNLRILHQKGRSIFLKSKMY